MAQLSSFATTASNVATDAATRTITISSEVVEIDGVLDPPTGYSDWGGWTILCQSSGGFRSTSGASGTLGGGTSSLRIVEATNGHRFGGDNFSNSNGSNARFAGDATNVLKYDNIVWIVESGGRSDFDIGRGTSSDGSSGCKVELTGVALYQMHASGGSGHFNHYSGQASIKIHSGVGYGLRIENRTNGPSIEFSTPIHTGAVVEGLVIANVTAAENNNGSRAAVRLEGVANNGTMTLSNLNTPSIANVNAPNNNLSRDATKTLLLIDPVGLPSRNDWSGRYHGNFEIRRNVPFEFTGATPTGETMHARYTTTGGTNASATMTGSTGMIPVRTHYSAHADSGTSTWSAYNTYRFFMTGLGFRKYSLTTAQTIANSPATITAALTPDVLPDGTAISAITAPTDSTPPDNLSEVIRAIKDVEAANPVTTGYPTVSLAYVDGNSIKINTNYSIDLNSGNDDLIYIENDPNGFGGLHIDLKSATTMSASNGLTTIDASGTGKAATLFSVSEDDDVFLKDSSGQKSVIAVTNNQGAATRFAVVDTSDGDTIGSNGSVSNNSTENIVINTKNLTTGYKLVSKRKGYNYYSADVDLTGGGLKSFTAPEPTRIVQPNGNASYVTSVTVPNTLTIGVTNSGSTPASRIECGNATFSARQIFKAWEDEIASADGDKYMGLGGQQVTYLESALKGNEIVLGAHTKVKRKATTDVNATIRATLYAPDDAPVDDSNGDVQTIEGLDEVALSASLWSSPTRTLTSGGGGGGATPQQIWEYSARTLTSTAPPSASDIADSVWSESTRTLTSNAAPSAASVATAVWGNSTRTLTSAAGLTATQATQLANASTKVNTIDGRLTDANNGLSSIATAVDAIPTDSGGGGPTVIYSRKSESFTITLTSYISADKEYTVSATDYAKLSTVMAFSAPRFLAARVNNQLESEAWYLRKEDDSNYKVAIYSARDSAENQNDDHKFSFSGSFSASGYTIRVGIQDTNKTTGYPSTFETSPWQLANKSTGYFKLDTGFVGVQYAGFSEAFQLACELQISYSDTESGTYTTWAPVQSIRLAEGLNNNNRYGFWEFQSDNWSGLGSFDYSSVGSFSNIYPLSTLPTVTDGKYVKFRLYYYSDQSYSNNRYPRFIDNCYLNLTIIDSLGVNIGGATDGGLTSVQATQLTNVASAVTHATYGLSPIKSAITSVASDVWDVDLSAAQTDDTAGDFVKTGGSSSGGFTSTDRTNLGSIKTTVEGISSPSASSIADAVWDENITSLTGNKAGAILNTAKADATSAKDDLANTTDGLGALKTAIDGVTDPSASDIASEVWGATTRTLTSSSGGATAQQVWEYSGTRDLSTSPPSASDIADEVWDKDISSLSGTKAGVTLNTAASDATSAKDDLANATDGLGALKSLIDTVDGVVDTIDGNTDSIASDVWGASTRTLTSSGSGGATAQEVWEYSGTRDLSTSPPTAGDIADAVWDEDISSLSGTKAGVTLNTAASDATSAKDDLANSTDGLGALKSLIDTVDGVVDTIDGNTDSIATDVWGAGTRTLTSSGSGGATAQEVWEYSGTRDLSTSPPSASDIADAVWDEDISSLSGTKAGVTLNSAASDASSAKDDLANSTDGLGALKSTLDTIDGNTDSIASDVWDADTRTLTSAGSSGATAQEVWEYSSRSLSTDPPSASDIASDVWSASTRTLTSTGSTLTAQQVWEYTDRQLSTNPPTASDIAESVWSEVIDSTITSDLTVTPENKAGDGFTIPADDAVLIANGDAFTFSNTGGYTNLNTTDTYYAYVSNNVLYVYTSKHNAITPGSSWIQPAGSGVATAVRIVVPEKRPIGTAGVALHRILAGIAEVDQNQEVSDDIKSMLDEYLGDNWVETGFSLKEAMQILVAVLAGRLQVTNNGGTFTFHRLDSAGTAVLRTNASDAGRTPPTRYN